MDELPVVLLGLRSAPKEDLGCAPAELLYGTTLHLPGEFFEAATAPEPKVSYAFTPLWPMLQPKETSHHRQHTAHMPIDLQTCTFVFVRHDAHRSPLQCTYYDDFLKELRNISLPISMANEIQCPSTVSSLHIWMPTSGCMTAHTTW